MNPVARVQRAMIAYFTGDVRRINHFLKVYGFAKAIGELEGLSEADQRTLEIAALTHDIGIRVSERKYRSAAGEYQQIEGPPEARKLLTAEEIDPGTVERVCWLIAHHHTYTDIREPDYRILVEADFLVNIHEDGLTPAAVVQIERSVFRTAAGIDFLRRLYRPEASRPTPDA